MKTNRYLQSSIATLTLCAAALWVAGCATTGSSPSASSGAPGRYPSKYHATDGRTIEIGKRSASDGGWSFKDPHLDQCWVAGDFEFKGFDTIYLVPTLSTAKFQQDEARPHELAKENLPLELKSQLQAAGIFVNVVTKETDIKPGARVLKLENTIVEYSKGGGAARYFVGLYGGGQPVLRVKGKMTDGDKTLFTYEARRSGVSAGARLMGASMSDENIQSQDIRSLVLDLTDFMAAIAGKYPPAK